MFGDRALRDHGLVQKDQPESSVLELLELLGHVLALPLDLELELGVVDLGDPDLLAPDLVLDVDVPQGGAADLLAGELSHVVLSSHL